MPSCAGITFTPPTSVWASSQVNTHTLLLHYRYTVLTLLLHCCHTVVTLLLHCCHTVVTLLLHGNYFYPTDLGIGLVAGKHTLTHRVHILSTHTH
jgi:hypothetical protein